MVARYGAEVAAALVRWKPACCATIRRSPATDAPQPSLLMVQAPIFHGHALPCFWRWNSPCDLDRISQALAGDHVTIAGAEEIPPSNVNAAGQANILVSVKTDANQPNGVWLWAAADNLRIAALTAVECAESMTATRPRERSNESDLAAVARLR